MSKIQLKVKKLHPDARTPTRATSGAAGYDLYAVGCNKNVPIYPDIPVTFRTGIAAELPPGYAMLIFSRSGHGFKHDTRLANCVGVIDSDYRGEIMVRLTRERTGRSSVLTVSPGDRIAQAVIIKVEDVEFVEDGELSETDRGSGGFGSTGS